MKVSLNDTGTLVATGYAIDSREVRNGDLFIALPGDHVDGHDFVKQAFENGAIAALVERKIPNISGVQIVVPNALSALQDLAKAARLRWGQTVIGVTGSAGKTSTKENIATLLSCAIPVSKTIGNFNNHIGLPLSILRIDEASKAAVLEMGMNHSGEIAQLCEIAKPQIGVVTNVGYAHAENFDGTDGIAAAKKELIDSLPADGVAVLNADDPLVAKFGKDFAGKVETFGLSNAAKTRATNLTYNSDGAQFQIEGQIFHSKVPGRIGVLNITAGVAVARMWGVPLRQLSDAAHQMELPKMRTEKLERNGVTIWNDCYNSNPDAAKAMLDLVRDTAHGRRIAVLGEMLELGHWAEALHSQLGLYAVESGFSVLLGIRGAARFTIESAMKAGLSARAACFFESPEEAGEYLKSIAEPGDTILFKGSRGTRVELALERFLS
ncbi:UDP-N-acetylmuramoyl-tripeptide--D-alanyl-D-alanine ligase [Bryobacter aggregatus]|uniref:UDP-N-acetylmuramoyl-tripeptide--D-alanyl-D- alanine ligase n=1 Tax=Bryobacter aggregatus TaxID=360054 RepID=UPI00056B1CB4|nr:UDP-N-acetylmuramoyl-tripeptide--D-alanyl-D-alanine ligase [Bryobacter aggregatus]